jgi:hypothetical protein
MLRFSAFPGFWERHLQRKFQYPQLFTDGSAVAQAGVDAARQRDIQEAQQFQADFAALLHEMAALRGAVETDQVLLLKERIDRLYILCVGLAGDLAAERRALVKLHDVVMGALAGVAGDDPLARDELAQEQAAHQLHLQLLECPLTASLLRADSPIAEDELAATLLAEDEEGLRVALGLFDARQCEMLYLAARELTDVAVGRGAEAATLRHRLAVMQDAVAGGAPPGMLQ